jgi:signal transduction histidine kinase
VEFINDSIQNLVNFSKKLNKIMSDSDLNQYRTELQEEIEELDLDFINEETQAAVNESLEGIDRITKIVNAMRTFSHPGNPEKSAVNINDIINKAIVVSRNEWKYDAEIKTEFQLDRLVPVFRGKLSQVILNLLVNAAHAIHEKKMETPGLITITTRELAEDMAEIRVSDNGTGIPKKIREKIFEPFFTTKEVGKGTGQGLAVIYNIIVKNHGGQVTFESEEGVGTTFIITLPIDQIEDEE